MSRVDCFLGGGLWLRGLESVRITASGNDHGSVSVALLHAFVVHDVLREIVSNVVTTTYSTFYP